MPSPPVRVLVLCGHYPPEPSGNAPYTGALARGIRRSGAAVRVITTHPSYPHWRIQHGYGQWSRSEQIDGVDVTRLRHFVPRHPSGLLRALSELSCGLRQATARWGRPDVIVAVSPMLLSTWLIMLRARIGHRATPVVVWVQDIYTLGLGETGQGSGAVLRAITTVERWVLRHAAKVVVIHDRFARRVAKTFGVQQHRIQVIRNWTHIAVPPHGDIAHIRAARGWSDADTVALHAGNMGVKQGLENVVAAAELAAQRDEKVKFVLLGGGSERGRLQTLAAGLPNIEFLDPLPDAEFAATLRAADVLLINEKPGVSEMSVPSKLTSYMTSGRPVLAATDPAGITAEELRNAEAGLVVPPGDPTALLDSVISLGSDVEHGARLGTNGKRYRESVLAEGPSLEKFIALLNSLANRVPTEESTISRNERSSS